MTYWYCQPILESYGLVAVATFLLVLLLLISPRFGSLTRVQKAMLIGLRLAVIGLLLLAMLRPTRVSTSKQPQSATLAVLFDKSRSMQLPHESGGKTRWEAELTTLVSAQPHLAEMAARMEVKLYAYDAQLHTLEFNDGKIKFPEKPDGGQTDIGTALSEAVRRDLGKRLAAVILLGDGVQTAFDPRVEMQEAARDLARLGFPLYTVPFGPTGHAGMSRDVAVESLPDQYTVFVKNELEIRGKVRVRGYVNKEIPITLTLENAAGEKQTIGTANITANKDDQQLDVSMTYEPQKTGQYKLTLKAADQSGEVVTKNNQLSAFLNVMEGGLKVLYLEGDLRLEQKFLRRSIDASPDIQLDFTWIDPRQRDKWPIDEDKVLKDPKFDAFIIGDLDSAALGNANLQLLAQAVDRGKGLVMLGGYHSFGPGGYFTTPLADVLPIKMDRFERQNFGEKPRADLQLPGPISIVPTKEHPITRLAASAENKSAWSLLPPLLGANKFVDVKDAAGVQVLAETPQGAPLMVSGEYGRGRVLAFAGDSTWQWWMRGRQVEHRRFWRQLILWLARRDDLEQSDVWLRLAQRRFPPGSRISFVAGAKTAAGDVIRDATYEAVMKLPSGDKQTLRLTADGDQMSGQIDAIKTPGDYLIELTALSGGKKIGSARAEFMVFDQDLELANPAADHDQLARLADITKEFGGKLIAPEQLNTLLQEIRKKADEFEVEIQSKWQIGDTALDTWLLFLIFIVLLTTEWALRKKWGLV